jgi:hypothetical protein
MVKDFTGIAINRVYFRSVVIEHHLLYILKSLIFINLFAIVMYMSIGFLFIREEIF